MGVAAMTQKSRHFLRFEGEKLKRTPSKQGICKE
jgi:hypothetical protein